MVNLEQVKRERVPSMRPYGRRSSSVFVKIPFPNNKDLGNQPQSISITTTHQVTTADIASTGGGAGGEKGDGSEKDIGKLGKTNPWTAEEDLKLALQGMKQLLLAIDSKRGSVDTKQFQLDGRTKNAMDIRWKKLKDGATDYENNPIAPTPPVRKTPKKRDHGNENSESLPDQKPDNLKKHRRDDQDGAGGCGSASGIGAH